MHGIAKAHTDARAVQARQRANQEKLNKYRSLSKAVFDMKEKGEHNQSALDMTRQLLLANPEVYTVWNFRRTVVLALLREGTVSLTTQHESEMSLTLACISKNPKSYWAWNHRRWACLLSEGAEGEKCVTDWSKEIKLCASLLDLDSRNFHCWDYRRWVVNQSMSSKKEELDFTTQKIESNFSNYSAWHYRSRLLPLLFPSHATEDKGGLDQSMLLPEFAMVQSACFTEPDDQSSWLYQMWLLGQSQQPLASQLCYGERNGQSLHTVIVFTQSVALANHCSVSIDDQLVTGRWLSAGPYVNAKYSHSWIFEGTAANQIEGTADVAVEMTVSPLASQSEDGTAPSSQAISVHFSLPAAGGGRGGVWVPRDTPKSINGNLATYVETQLDSYSQLLALEPESKWTLLATVHMMLALDKIGYFGQVVKTLDQLAAVDKPRKNYYHDLRSTVVLENRALALLREGTNELQPPAIIPLPNLQHFDCDSQRITRLTCTYLLAPFQDINLSSNQISSLSDCPFIFAKRLVLDDNCVTGIDCDDAQSLSRLQFLSLCNNDIKRVQDLSGLVSLSYLQSIRLAGNPLALEPNYIADVMALCPSLNEVDGVRG